MRNLEDVRPRLSIIRSHQTQLQPSSYNVLRADVGHTNQVKVAALVETLDHYKFINPKLKWRSPESRKRRRHWQHGSISQAVSQLDMTKRESSSPQDENETPSTIGPNHRQAGARESYRHSILPTPLPISPNGTRAAIRQYHRSSSNSDGSPNYSSSESDEGSEPPSSDESPSNRPVNHAHEAPPRKKRKCDETSCPHQLASDSGKCDMCSSENERQGILGAAAGLLQTVSQGLKTFFTKTYESSLLGIRDLAASSNEGRIVYYSNGASGRTIDSILTGSRQGWITENMAVTNPPQYEWCIVCLGSPGVIKGVLIDTTGVTIEHPMAISIEAAFFPKDQLEQEICALEDQSENSEADTQPPLSPSRVEELLDGHSIMNSDQWKDIRPVTFVTTPGIGRYSVTTYDRIQSHVRINLFTVCKSMVPEKNSFVPQSHSNKKEKEDEETTEAVGYCGLTRIGVFAEPADPEAAIVQEGDDLKTSPPKHSPLRRPSILEESQATAIGRPTPLRPHWLSFRKSVLRQLNQVPNLSRS